MGVILYLTTINNLNTIRKEPTEKSKIQLMYFNATVTLEFGQGHRPNYKGAKPSNKKITNQRFSHSWLTEQMACKKKKKTQTQFLHVKCESAVKTFKSTIHTRAQKSTIKSRQPIPQHSANPYRSK